MFWTAILFLTLSFLLVLIYNLFSSQILLELYSRVENVLYWLKVQILRRREKSPCLRDSWRPETANQLLPACSTVSNQTSNTTDAFPQRHHGHAQLCLWHCSSQCLVPGHSTTQFPFFFGKKSNNLSNRIIKSSKYWKKK